MFLTSVLQSIRQCVLDEGDSGTAASLVPAEDPLTRATFAAGEQELAELYSYKKAIKELKARALKTSKEGDETAEEAGGDKQPGRRDRKKK